MQLAKSLRAQERYHSLIVAAPLSLLFFLHDGQTDYTRSWFC